MDPTQDLAETRKLMASVKEAVDKIIEDFGRKRQQASLTNVPVQGKA